MSEITEVKKARTAARGQVTRVSNLILRMSANTLDNYDLDILERYTAQLAKADHAFSKAHHSLYELDVSLDQEQYHIEDEDHQTILDSARKASKKIKMCVTSKRIGKKLIPMLECLQANIRKGYAPSLAGKFEEVRLIMNEYEDSLSKDGVDSNACIQDMRKIILDLWCEVDEARTASGYVPPSAGSSGTSGGTTSASTTPALPKVTALAAKLPSFSGRATEFQDFKRLFLAILSSQTQLDHQSKKSLLLDCMTTKELKDQVRMADKEHATFEDAMEAFSKHHENNREVVAYHWHEILKMPILNQTHKDIQAAIRYLADDRMGIKLAKCLTADQLIVSYMDSRFGPALQLAWRTFSQHIEGVPEVADLRKFLDGQESIVARATLTQPAHAAPQHKQKKKPFHKTTSHEPPPKERSPSPTPSPRTIFQATRQRSCVYCSGDHSPFSCSSFKEKTPQQRYDWVRSEKRCFNCMGNTHMSGECKSLKRCQDCDEKHHTLIHITKPKESQKESSKATNCIALDISTRSAPPVTAVVPVSSGHHTLYARVMVDTGAEISVVSKDFANSLDAIRLRKPPMKIGGMGAVTSPYAVRLSLHGDEDMGRENDSLHIEARVLDTIPQPTSTSHRLHVKDMPFLAGCPLADPEYRPGDRIDILLDQLSWYTCRTGDSLKGPEVGLIADCTMFGWVIGGAHYAKSVENSKSPNVSVASPLEEKLDVLVEKLGMEPEMPGDKSTLSVQDERAEQVFVDTCLHMPDNRYEAGMPVLEDPPPLGESRSTAVSRYRSVEAAMKKKGTWEAYKAAVMDFITSGHAEVVPPEDLLKPCTQHYYMPMHGVYKETSTSTKVRPVCDASARTTTGISYNDTLVSGPSLYNPLPATILKFRDEAIAMTADVSKMYRQVSLRREDRDFHRFVFTNAEGHLTDYRMTRLTFGVKASPFVATRVLHQIASDQQENFPKAAEVIRECFYVDDVLTGAPTVDQALQLREDLNSVLESGKMPLCKWRSNSSTLLESIPEDLVERSDLKLTSSPTSQQKTLGVHWATLTDNLYVSTPTILPSPSTTKRQLVSAMAQVYDPLGWFTPAIMTPRVMAQQAWRLGVQWDEVLPDSIQLPWQVWLDELPSISNHPIHRPYGSSMYPTSRREIHGFSDASEVGYGGVVYLKSLHEDGTTSSDLLTSKGRVAPMKKTTIPRLELKGAVVVVELLQFVAQHLHIDPSDIHAWTDSTIVLAWIKHPPEHLTVYVGNRVRLIQKTLPSVQWRHVPGSQNPADCLSRGLRPVDACEFSLWWQGPRWLKLDSTEWPPSPVPQSSFVPETRNLLTITRVDPPDLSLDQRDFSHWVRIVAWIRRFWRKLTKATDTSSESFLTSDELLEARTCVFRASQRSSLSYELDIITSNRTLPKHHHLSRLTPFIDDDGLMKVGGRLDQSHLPDSAKHPIILHHHSHVVRLLVESTHRRMLHPPISATLATLSYSYHIPRVKPLLKSICQKCVICHRKWGRPVRQRMADLPAIRSDTGEVFKHVGVDYAGPVFIYGGRGVKRVKSYIALFICLSTRAIHLELAADASTPAFLAALDRFCGRRGMPAKLFSDNGGNFQGAARELQELLHHLHSPSANDSISRWSANHGFAWIFQPALSPHRGGLWEAGVKSLKSIIRDQLYHLHLTMDELQTILVSAEAVLNSRPYLPIHSTDADALVPLTPAHFLVHKPLCAMPQRADTISKIGNLRHWNLVKRIQHSAWKQFQRTYIPQLSARAKVLCEQTNLRVGDVVLIQNHQTSRNHWPLGIITATHAGPDGLVRTVDIKVETSGNASKTLRTHTFKRAVQHLIKMPIDTTPATDPQTQGVRAGESVQASN